jgi:hypothetical protein
MARASSAMARSVSEIVAGYERTLGIGSHDPAHV